MVDQILNHSSNFKFAKSMCAILIYKLVIPKRLYERFDILDKI